jgi:ketosteroid isomerase-like protein
MSATSFKIPASGDEARIRKLIESTETLIRRERLHPAPELHWENLTVTSRGDYACCSGLLRVTRSLTKQNATADRTLSLWRYATLRVERTAGVWRIVHARFRAVSHPPELPGSAPGAPRAWGALPAASIPAPAAWSNLSSPICDRRP